jgi:hypothetical protein
MQRKGTPMTKNFHLDLVFPQSQILVICALRFFVSSCSGSELLSDPNVLFWRNSKQPKHTNNQQHNTKHTNKDTNTLRKGGKTPLLYVGCVFVFFVCFLCFLFLFCVFCVFCLFLFVFCVLLSCIWRISLVKSS